MPPDTAPALDELRAHFAAAAEALRLAEAEAAKGPPLSIEDAEAKLAEAEQLLEAAERPYWDREHARVAVATLKTEIEKVTHEGARAAMEADVPALEQAHSEATAAHEAHVAKGVTDAHIDAAAQLVLDAREELKRARKAVGLDEEIDEPAEEVEAAAAPADQPSEEA